MQPRRSVKEVSAVILLKGSVAALCLGGEDVCFKDWLDKKEAASSCSLASHKTPSFGSLLTTEFRLRQV